LKVVFRWGQGSGLKKVPDMRWTGPSANALFSLQGKRLREEGRNPHNGLRGWEGVFVNTEIKFRSYSPFKMALLTS